MSRINFTFGVLVLPLALVSTQAQGWPPPPDPGTAIVSGVVRLKGEPSCGVTVWLADQRPRSFNNHAVKTDKNGRFRIANVASGKYWIAARMIGHFYPDFEDGKENGWPLDVAEGEKIESVALEVKRGGVIAGRIADSRGDPLIGGAIRLHMLDKEGKPQIYPYSEGCRTDDRGAYRIYNLPEGRYLVSVVSDEKRRFYPGVASESEAKVIEVADESEAGGIDITLPGRERPPVAKAVTGDISVRLVTEDGVELPNVKVNVIPVTVDDRPILTSSAGYLYTTNENGIFTFTTIRPENGSGYYWLRVIHAEGYVARNLVSPLAGDDITVNMIKGGLITGRITNAKGEPVVGAIIKSRMERDVEGKPPMQRGITLMSVTDDRGVYRFWGLMPGNYIVFTNSNLAGHFGCSNNGLTMYRTSSTREKFAEVTVRSGVETSGIDIRYREGQGRIK